MSSEMSGFGGSNVSGYIKNLSQNIAEPGLSILTYSKNQVKN